MRSFLIVPVALCVIVLAQPALAEEPAEIIEKAIKAHGGLEKLIKIRDGSLQTKSKGVAHTANVGDLELAIEGSSQGGKSKEVIEVEVMGQKVTQIIGYNGKELWMTLNGMDLTSMFGEKFRGDIPEQVYQGKVAGLTLFKDKKLKLSALGETKVNDKAAIGIRVSSEGHRDVSLYFDKEKGLLVKTEGRGFDPMGDKEITVEKIFKDYKEVGGYMRPTKVDVLHDGKKHVEIEILEVKFVDKFDDSIFDKP